MRILRFFLIVIGISSFFASKLMATGSSAQESLKPRLVVLTDLAPGDVEPDDMESIVRLLVHADLYEIEAIITTSGWNSSEKLYPESWRDILMTEIAAYEKDLPNLMKRSGQSGFLPAEQEEGKQSIGYWPSADYLRNRAKMGSLDFGREKLGEGNDSDGSELIIRLLKESDERPIWFGLWGGGNTLAQALWRIKNEWDETAMNACLEKIYVYAITDQDVPIGNNKDFAFSSHQWMRETFGDRLHFIWDESAWLSQNTIGRDHWEEYATHIQGHGHLGQIYPKFKYGVEGDTPSFLHLMPNGLNDPTQPGQVGWAGYFEWVTTRDQKTACYTNSSPDIKEISRKYEAYFYPAAFSNFAARMEWAESGQGNRNPVVVVNGDQGLEPDFLEASCGETVSFDASGSYDPDGDALDFRWWILPEAGTYKGDVDIIGAESSAAKIVMPESAAGQTIHLICEVTDQGHFNLKSYRRIVITYR